MESLRRQLSASEASKNGVSNIDGRKLKNIISSQKSRIEQSRLELQAKQLQKSIKKDFLKLANFLDQEIVDDDRKRVSDELKRLLALRAENEAPNFARKV